MSTLQTNRLLLRPFKQTDAETMYKNWTYDARVAKYCRWYPHESIDTTRELLKMYLDAAAQGFAYQWAIVLDGTDEPIGAIDVVDMDEENKTAEIGYVLSHDHWCNGYATEALKAVIGELFRCGFVTIKAAHHVDNPASGKVMEKCGMTFTHYDKEIEKFGSDKLCDVKWYRIENKHAILGKLVTVTVDRPLGSFHPKYKDMYYPINYGYIAGIMAPDGEEQDAYILGVDKPMQEFTGRVIAIICRSDDVEEKWVVAPDEMTFTKDEIMDAVRFQEQYFQSEVITG